MSTRPVTGRVGRGGGGPPRRGAGRVLEVGPLAVARPAVGRRLAGQRRVGVVDLGHPPRRGLDGRRVVAGQVGMVERGEPPPGGLDLGRGGAARDAEDDVRIAFRHAVSVPAAARMPALDRPALRAVP